MKQAKNLLIVVAIILGAIPALAQHGHAGGMGMGMCRGVGAGAPGTGHAPNGPGNLSTRGPKTPVELLSQNPKLASRLQPLLPAGSSVQAAASGFKNVGQFVAAVHVSHNLGIPFSQLKADAAASGMSLGKAIHDLRPMTNAKAELKRAKKQGKQDMKASGA